MATHQLDLSGQQYSGCAVNAATNLSTIWVDDGTYRFPTNAVGSNVVNITKALTLRGVNGAASTIIDGGGLYRCVYVFLPSAACAVGPIIIDGFTLTNGFADGSADSPRGAGIYLQDTATGTGIVQNCIISGNIVQKNTVDNYAGGGGLHAVSVSFIPVISNCLVVGNKTIEGNFGFTDGAGLWFRAEGLIVDCVFRNNESSQHGGAMYLRQNGTVVDRCIIVSNTAALNGYGGGVFTRDDNEFRNSLIAYNTAAVGGGVSGYGVLRMYNCTVVNNVNNCIVDNIAVGNTATVTGYNNCLPSIPANGDWHNTLVTTNNPAMIKFVDAANGNFRLASGSPCINAGINEPDWLADVLDLDGNARIDRFSGHVDIGCYEYQPSGMIIFLQ